MIRTGELTEESKDEGPFRLVRVASDGDEKDAVLVDFGGVVSAPLKGSQVLLIQADGEDGKLYAIAFAPPADRIDQNKPGENRIKNLKTGALFEQNEDGSVNINAPGKLTINAPDIVLEGNTHLGGEGGELVHRKDDLDSDGDAAVGSATKVYAV